MKIACVNPKAVVKRALFLAYQASGVFGMGVLQARDGMDEEAVWNRAYNADDYGGSDSARGKPGSLSADYVAGRMMKLNLKWDGESVEVSDSQPRRDYQSWCGKYPTFESLIKAAMVQVNKAN